MSKSKTIVSWVLIVIVGVLFVLGSLGKLFGAVTPRFAEWRYPAWFATFIGVVELAGGIGLLVPKTTKFAILGLTIIMVGAAYTHLVNNEDFAVLRPIVFAAALWAVWLLRGYSFSRKYADEVS